MARDMEMKYLNTSGEWERLNPKSMARLIETEDGLSVEDELGSLSDTINNLDLPDIPDLSNYATTDYVDSTIDNLDFSEVEVSEIEPTNKKVWFELL